MFVSIILSTFNHPEWLRKSLAGYATQTRRPNQIVVADDGSNAETETVIRSFRQSVGIPLVHVWHPNDGFRKCTILNRAIETARGQYLIFSDGDCIPRKDFVATHCRLARAGRFLSGGMLRLPPSVSEKMGVKHIESGSVFSPNWLLRNGATVERQLKLLSLFGRAAELADYLTTTRPTFNGHNASAWKRDILRINGFDQRMRYGGLDRELGERLENANVRGAQIRHRAVCVHLHHERPYLDGAALLRNRMIRQETADRNRDWTPFGIKQTERREEPTVFQTQMSQSEHATLAQTMQTIQNRSTLTENHVDSNNVNVDA